MSKLTVRRGIIACALAALTVPAFADSVVLTGFAFGSRSARIDVFGDGSAVTPLTVSAGAFTGTLNGNSFITYCTDVYQSFNFSTTPMTHTVVDGVAAWGAAKATDLGRLFTGFSAGVNTADESAAFQLAVWEIIYENPANAYDIGGSAGVFRVSNITSAVRNLATGYLTGLPTTSLFDVDKLFHPNKQDFLLTAEFAPPVPEASTYGMMLAGLGLLGLVARRRMGSLQA